MISAVSSAVRLKQKLTLLFNNEVDGFTLDVFIKLVENIF